MLTTSMFLFEEEGGGGIHTTFSFPSVILHSSLRVIPKKYEEAIIIETKRHLVFGILFECRS